MRVLSSRRVLAGLAFVLAGTTSSLAADAQAFGDRLKALMAEQEATLSYTAASSEGDDVILADASVRGNGPGEEALPLGDLRFEGVSGSTPDGWRVVRVAPADIDQTEGPTRLRASGLVIDGLQIRGTNAGTASASPIFFDRVAIGSLTAEQDARPVFSMNGAELRTGGDEQKGYTGTFGVQSFTADTQGPEGGEGSKVMADLGYQQLTGSASGNASWNPQSGALTLDPLQVVVNDAGSLNFAYTITGYTPSFIQSLTQISQQMKASGGQNESSGMAMIGLISQLYLQSANSPTPTPR